LEKAIKTNPRWLQAADAPPLVLLLPLTFTTFSSSFLAQNAFYC